jgi:hypothetical protein
LIPVGSRDRADSHTTTPHLASGASIAIEDSIVLARLLQTPVGVWRNGRGTDLTGPGGWLS